MKNFFVRFSGVRNVFVTFFKIVTDKQTDRQTDRQTNRQTDRQTTQIYNRYVYISAGTSQEKSNPIESNAKLDRNQNDSDH